MCHKFPPGREESDAGEVQSHQIYFPIDKAIRVDSNCVIKKLQNRYLVTRRLARSLRNFLVVTSQENSLNTLTGA